jgi:hypothetical protein
MSERGLALKGMSKGTVSVLAKLSVIVAVHSVFPPRASNVRFSGSEEAVPLRIPPELKD